MVNNTKQTLSVRIVIIAIIIALFYTSIFGGFFGIRRGSAVNADSLDSVQPVASASSSIVSINWAPGTKIRSDSKEYAGNVAYTTKSVDAFVAIVTLNNPVPGVTVTARIKTFDISAKARTSSNPNGEYAPVDRDVVLTGDNTSQSIYIYVYQQYNYSKGVVDSVSYMNGPITRQFGVRIASVSNGHKDLERNTLRAQVAYSKTFDLQTNKNTGYYNVPSTASNAYMPDGYVYSGAYYTAGKTLYFNDNSSKSSLWISAGATTYFTFNPYLLVTNNSATNALLNYYSSMGVYINGRGTIAQTWWAVSSNGAEHTLSRNGVNEYYGKYSRDWDSGGESIGWFDTKFLDGGRNLYGKSLYTINARNSTASSKFEEFKGSYFPVNTGTYRMNIKNTASTWDKEFSNYYVIATVADYATPQVIGYHLSNERYGYGDEMYIAVQFDKPVQVDNNNLALQVWVGNVGESNNTLEFTYAGGSCTDYLLFKTRLTSDNLKTNNLRIVKFVNTYSGSSSGARVNDLLWNGSNHNNFWVEPSKGYINPELSSSSSNPLALLNCAIDTRTPVISPVSDDGGDGKVARTHSARVQISSMEKSTGKVETSWDTSQIVDDRTVWTETEFTTGAEYNDFSASGFTGTYYLHVRATSVSGQQAVWTCSTPFVFDNIGPTVSNINCTDPGVYSGNHTFSAVISDSGGSTVKEVYMSVYTEDRYGASSPEPIEGWNWKKVYDSHLSGNKMTLSGSTATVTISESEINLPEESFGGYWVAFYAVDALANAGDKAYGRQIAMFDNRETFTSSSDTEADMTIDGKYVYYNQRDDGNIKLAFSADQVANNMFVNTIRRNGSVIYYSADAVGYSSAGASGSSGWEQGEGKDYGIAEFDVHVSDGNASRTVNITFNEKASGYFEIILGSTASSSISVSNVHAFYISPLPDSEYNSPVNYTEITSPTRLLVNKVWQYATGRYFTYENIGKTNIYYTGNSTSTAPIFSDKDKALEYAKFMEYQDMSLLYLGDDNLSIISLLNGGTSAEYRKATGESATAAKGQTWIRYKSINWTYNITPNTSQWVYYFYDSTNKTTVDVSNLSGNLKNVLDINAKKICNYDGDWVYLYPGSSTADSFGQPRYPSDAIFYEQRTVTEGFSTPLVYGGDENIYDSYISYYTGSQTLKVPIIANYSFKVAGRYDAVYYRKYGDTSWALVSAGQTLKDIVGSSALYEFAEIGGNGYRTYYAYVDISEPVIAISYTQEGSSGTSYIDGELDGTTFRAASVTLHKILTADNLSDADIGMSIEYDKWAYVYLTTTMSTSSTVKAFLTMDELNSMEEGYTLPNGSYYLYAYDRLGNSVCVTFKANDSDLEVTMSKNASGTAISLNINRTENDIVDFYILRDGVKLNLGYAQTFTFVESGNYSVYVEDVYGNSVLKEFEFYREPPEVSLYYMNNNGVAVRLTEDSVGGAAIVERVGNVYQISAAANIRISWAKSAGYDYSFETEDLPIVSFPGSLSNNVLEISSESINWSLRVFHSNDPSTFVLITCRQDKAAPAISASATVPYYTYNDQAGDNVLFTKDGTAEHPIVAGGSQDGSSATVSWSDDTYISKVSYRLNDGEEVELTATDIAKGSMTFTEQGSYVIVATDALGNSTNFSFTLTKSIDFDYIVDGEKTEYKTNPLDYIINGTFTYTQYTGVEVSLVLREDVHIAYMWTDGTDKYIYGILYSGGSLATYHYDESQEDIVIDFGTVTVDDEGSEVKTSVALQNGDAGQLMPGPALINYLYKDGTLTITMPATTCAYELWQMRVANAKGTMPFVVQFERSNVLPGVEIVRKGGYVPLVLNENDFVGINTEAEIVSYSIDKTSKCVSIVAYYSTVYTTTFAGAEMITLYQAGSHPTDITERGYYKIVATNVYGNKQIMLLRLSFSLEISVLITYDDSSDRAYSLSDPGEYTLYGNKSVAVSIWDTACTASATWNGVNYSLNLEDRKGYLYFAVSGVGEYVFTIRDDCDNVFVIRLDINAPETLIYKDYLHGFNDEALMKDKFYTNGRLSLDYERITANGIEYVAYSYTGNNGETNFKVLYDLVSQTRVVYDEAGFNGSIGGDGNGVYYIIFGDKYGNSCTFTAHISNEHQLLIYRTIQNDAVEREYDLNLALEKGAWSNQSIVLYNAAMMSKLWVDGKLTSFADGKYTFVFPSNLGEGCEEHTVAYLDEYGNKYAFTVYLYRKVPEVQLLSNIPIYQYNNKNYIRQEFAYTWTDERVTASYTIIGMDKPYSYTSGQMITMDGAYTITFTDWAGNVAVRTLILDTIVSYRLLSGSVELENYVTTSSSVNIVQSLETISIVSATRDGVPISGDTMQFSEHGRYEIVIADPIGNRDTVVFTIYKHNMQSFTFTTEENYIIAQVWYIVDGFRLSYTGDVTTNDNGRQGYKFQSDGEYIVELRYLPTGDIFEFTVNIDNIPPDAVLVGVENKGSTRKDITIEGLKVGDTVEVYQDGKLITRMYIESVYQAAPQISKAGSYRVVIYDEAGNITEYTFEREYTTNTASNIFILLFFLLLAGGIIIAVRMYGKLRTK